MEDETGVTPPALQRRIVSYPWTQDALDAFHVLSQQRQSDQGILQPISFEAMALYCQTYQVPDPVRLIALIKACDAAFRTWARRKRDAENQTEKPEDKR